MKGFKVDLTDRVAIVTGARRGIGRAIAVALSEAGARVLVNDLATEELERVAGEIRDKGGESRAYQADISVKEQAEGLVAEALRIYGRVDIMVNNASILSVASFLETREGPFSVPSPPHAR